ncbi:sclerostin domain-containing protein 1b [Paramormyrops kingsleyae]|uniref:Sclerostin domain containing 1b n=1 Tax=Paramormyrops kingsleyae TaxID=1676925 RepID=A0A3B3SGS8_9TELE|nr:sclerostin domain-containing protein 1-like [Paramormyrops kingsleyae]
MPSITCEYPLLFLFCIFMDSCQSFSNDATEIVNSHLDFSALDTPNNTSFNRARNGGKRLGSTERSERSQVGCRELRSTKYISDGMCTSLSPVKELVCAGECLPPHMVPNWIGGYVGKFWARREGQSWKCVNDRTRTQRIRLQCQDGSTRTYKITAVTSCKCKRCSRQHNDSGHNPEKGPAHVRPHEPKSKPLKPKGRNPGETKKKMTPRVERD